MQDELGDGFPLAVRDALAKLLLVALQGRDALGALERATELAHAGLAIRSGDQDGFDERDRAARDALIATGLALPLAEGEPIVEASPPDTSGIVAGSPGGSQFIDPLLALNVRSRLDAYVRVLSVVPRGRTVAIALTQARALFAERLFFEVHEVLEPAWRASIGRERRTLQAVIQTAVAYYHLGRGNLRGAETLARYAEEKLAEADAAWHDLDLHEVVRAARALAHWLAAGADGVPPPSPFTS